MNFRETLGLILIVIALVLIPLAWMHSRLLLFAAFGLFLIGFALFLTERINRRMEEQARQTGGENAGTAVPTDIHNYTGWRHGGRSDTMDGDGDGGGGD